MRRWLRKWNLVRLFLAFLLTIYGILFLQAHQLTISADHENTNTNTNKNGHGRTIVVEPPSFQKRSRTNGKGQDIKDDQDTANNALAIAPHNNNFTFGLLDGNVNEYLESGNDLWEHTMLPDWMKRYFEWHKEQRSLLVSNNDDNNHKDHWKALKYYIVECSDLFDKCGGTADRLGPLPFHVRMASQYNRLLFIRWERPAPLEFFLEPPVGGVDWRIPDGLWEELVREDDGSWDAAPFEDRIIKLSKRPKLRLVRVKYQSHNHGQSFYDRMRIETNDPNSYAQVYHDLWRIFFTPTTIIAELIEQQMKTLGLLPGLYVSAHIRALYGVDTRDDNMVQWWARNAIHCVTTKFPTFYPPPERSSLSTTTTTTTTKSATTTTASQRAMPILFVSDSTFATEAASSYATDYLGFDQGLLVHRTHSQQPVHLEKANDTSTNIEDYYDTFVDVYMIGMGRCTAYNMGGFGRWGSMMSYNSSCVHFMKANMDKCDLSKAGRKKSSLHQEGTASVFPNPLFLPPMPQSHQKLMKTPDSRQEVPIDRKQEDDNPIVVNSPGHYQLAYNISDEIFNDPLLYELYDSDTWGPNLWARSKKIPKWMKKYFKWHKQQRHRHLNRESWRSMRFLVMQCLENHPKCGGTSDRLKPLPTMLRIAYVTNRFLLIHWRRPAKLEDFLLPPKGGIDWRVPDWLHPLISDYGLAGTLVDNIREMAQTKNESLRTKYQSFDGGQGWYNEMLIGNETQFNELYHDVWQVFFTPAPPVARLIKTEMIKKGLVPGEYASAHLRALYAMEFRHLGTIKRWTMNALNCASKLRPGKSIFLASDSQHAPEIGKAYGERVNGIVVTHQNNPDPPLHLDKAENVADQSDVGPFGHSPSDYYDTFIDLYLLAFGRCVFFSKGGFGNWALLIGGNITCAIKFKRSKKGIQNPCNWTVTPSSGTQQEQMRLQKPLFLEPMF